MIQVPDAASLAAIRFLRYTGHWAGGSTDEPLRRLHLISRMLANGERGSVVTLRLCERYAGTYYNDAWLAEHGLTSNRT